VYNRTEKMLLGNKLSLDYHPVQGEGEGEVFPVAPCCGKQNELIKEGGSQWSMCDFTSLTTVIVDNGHSCLLSSKYLCGNYTKLYPVTLKAPICYCSHC